MKTARSLTATFVFTFCFLSISNQTFGQAQAPPVRSPQQGSLQRVPDTAGYYISTMNHQASLSALFESEAWKSLKSTDVAKGMKKAYRRGKSRGYEDYNEDNPFAQYLKGYGDTVGSVVFQSVWQVAKEVVDNELFIYVDNDAIALSKAVSKFQLAILEAMPPKGNEEDERAKEEFMQQLADSFQENFADIECPTMMMGSRLNEPEEFQGMLELLKSLAEQAMTAVPNDFRWVKKWWNVVDEEGQYLMAIDIDLSDVPVRELLKEMNDPSFGRILQNMGKDKKASIVLGIVDDLLILAVARNKEKLVGFGSTPLLIDTPFAGKLRAAIDNGDTITGVAYLSKEMTESAGSQQQATDSLNFLVKTVMKEMGFGDDATKEQMTDETTAMVTEFFADLRSLIPEPGAILAFSSLQEDGIHVSAMYQSKIKTWDASQSLDISNRAGPDTVAFIAQRPNSFTKQYEIVSKWSARAFDLAQRLGKDQMIESFADSMEDQPKEAAKEDATRIVENLLANIERLFSKFDTVTRKRLLPAIEGQQMSVIVDMVSGPEAWCEDMQPSAKLLSLPLPALLVGHRDSEKLIEAGARYLGVINEGIRLTLDTIKEITPSKIPEGAPIEIPAPERIEDGNEVSFRWNMLTKYLRADQSLRTGTRVSENWLVMNFHEAQAKRLTGTPSANDLFGPALTNEPSALLAFLDNRVLMEHARQWAEYAISFADEDTFNLSQYEAERDTLQFTDKQLREAIDGLWSIGKCFKGISLRSWEIADGTATEILFKFQDIEP